MNELDFEKKKRIAVIMTAHNRKDKTIMCLRSLYSQSGIENLDVFVFLTDDGCTDDTVSSVLANFSNVKVVKGDGNLYWSRGMYVAWKEAEKESFDYYLWLNDDIVLYKNLFSELFLSYSKVDQMSIITGIIENETKTKTLYGAKDSKGVPLPANGTPQKVPFMNGNLVLVPQKVVDKIGIIDKVYHHDLGDFDYGLTAQEHGIGVYTSCCPLAYGYENNIRRKRKWGVSLVERLKNLNNPLLSPPYLSLYFKKKHHHCFRGVFWAAVDIFVAFFPDHLVHFLFPNRY